MSTARLCQSRTSGINSISEWEKRPSRSRMCRIGPGPMEHRHEPLRPREPAAGEYLSMSYYQIWFAALETMLKERGPGSG